MTRSWSFWKKDRIGTGKTTLKIEKKSFIYGNCKVAVKSFLNENF